MNKEQLERRKKDIEYINSVPKKEYIGNFTYNGKTINIKELEETIDQQTAKQNRLKNDKRKNYFWN